MWRHLRESLEYVLIGGHHRLRSRSLPLPNANTHATIPNNAAIVTASQTIADQGSIIVSP